MATKEELVLEIEAEIGKLKQALNEVKKQLKSVDKTTIDSPVKRFKESLKSAKRSLIDLRETLFSLKTAIVAAFSSAAVGLFSKSIIDTASRIEQLRLRISVLGKETQENFSALYEYAKKLPFPIEQTMEALISMGAQGLRPTQKQFEILMDTVAALGGSQETLEGIARALAQIHTKGKVQLEELYQLAERGVPAFQILREELGLTGQQLQNIAQSGISADRALEALFRGLEKRFGGFSKRFANTWQGLVNQLKNIWTDFKKQVADTGYFRALKRALADFVRWANSKTGQLKLREWAKKTGKALIVMVKIGVSGFKWLATAVLWGKKAFDSFVAIVKTAAVKLAEFWDIAGIKFQKFKTWLTEFPGKEKERKLKELDLREKAVKVAADLEINKIKENYERKLRQTEEAIKTIQQTANELNRFLDRILEEGERLREAPEGKDLGAVFSKAIAPIKNTATQASEALKKLREEWTKVRKELQLSLSLPYMDEFDKKLMEINLKAEELKKKFKDIKGAKEFIERWKRAQIEIVKTQKEQKELNELLEEYQKEFDELTKKELERIEAKRTALETKLKELEAQKELKGETEETLKQEIAIYNQILKLEKEKLSWLEKGTKEYEEQKKKITELKLNIEKLKEPLKGFWEEEFAQGLRNVFENTFSSIFEDLLLGKLKKAEDYFRAFLRSVAHLISQLLAQLLAQKFMLNIGVNLQGAGIPALLGAFKPLAGLGIGAALSSFLGLGNTGVLLGGLAGTLFNMTAWGTGISTAIGAWAMSTFGTAVGSFLGNFILPIGGAIIGGILGKIFGGLFGGEDRDAIREARAKLIDKVIEQFIENTPVPITSEQWEEFYKAFEKTLERALIESKDKVDLRDEATKKQLLEIGRRALEGIIKGLSPEEIRQRIYEWIEKSPYLKGWGKPETDRLVGKILDNIEIWKEKLLKAIEETNKKLKDFSVEIRRKILEIEFGAGSKELYEFDLSNITSKLEEVKKALNEALSTENWLLAASYAQQVYQLTIQKYQLEISYLNQLISQLNSFISFADNLISQIDRQLGVAFESGKEALRRLYEEYLNLPEGPERWRRVQELAREAYSIIMRMIEEQRRAYEARIRRQIELQRRALEAQRRAIRERYEYEIQKLREIKEVFREMYEFAYRKLYEITYQKMAEYLAPKTQLSNIESEINALLPEALGGNREAFSRLRELLGYYEELIMRYFYPGTPEWKNMMDKLKNLYSQLEEAGSQYKSYEEQIKELQERMNAELQSINAQISSLNATASNYIPPATQYLKTLKEILLKEKEKAEKQREEAKAKLEEVKNETVAELKNIASLIDELRMRMQESVNAETQTAQNTAKTVEELKKIEQKVGSMEGTSNWPDEGWTI